MRVVVYDSLAEGLPLKQLNDPDKHLVYAFANESAHVYANENYLRNWHMKYVKQFTNVKLFFFFCPPTPHLLHPTPVTEITKSFKIKVHIHSALWGLKYNKSASYLSLPSLWRYSPFKFSPRFTLLLNFISLLRHC